jgi:hypothetical protein
MKRALSSFNWGIPIELRARATERWQAPPPAHRTTPEPPGPGVRPGPKLYITHDRSAQSPCVPVNKVTCHSDELPPSFFPVFLHHFLHQVARVANWGSATGPTVGASFTAPPTGPVGIVRTRAISTVARNGLGDDCLPDFPIGFRRRFGLTPCDSKYK